MLLANIIFGIMAPCTKYITSHSSIDGFALTGFRIIGACILFWIAALFSKKEKVEKTDRKKLFFASAFAVTFNQLPFITGVSLTSPVNASVIVTALPIITMIISFIILKEPVSFKKVAGIVFGLSGALILIFHSVNGNSSSDSSVWGDLLCLWAQISFSFYIVLYKDLAGKYSPVTMMSRMFLYAALCCGPFLIPSMVRVDYVALSIYDYLSLTQIVVFGSFIAYFLIPIGQHRLRPTLVVMYSYIQPPVASLACFIIGVGTLGFYNIISILFIFTGVVLVTRSKKRSDIQMNNSINMHNK